MPARVRRRSPFLASAAGALVAVFVLVGRWTPSRLTDSVVDRAALDPRLWILACLAFVVLLLTWNRSTGRLPRDQRILRNLLVVFLGYEILTWVWAPDVHLAEDKALDLLLVLAFLWMLGPVATVEDADSWMWRWIGAVGVALATVALLSPGLGEGRIAVLGGGPNMFGRIMGLTLIATIHFSRGHPAYSPWQLMGAVVLVLTVLSGSRGALLATGAALITHSLLEMRSHSILRRWLSGAVAVFAVAMYTDLGARARETFQQRVIHLTIEEGYASGRWELFDQAWSIWERNPVMGAGLAAFEASGSGIYPHNLFLECLVDGGLVSVLLLAVTLAWYAKVVLRRRQDLNSGAVAAFALSFSAAQFSGDLFDSRSIFIFMLLTLEVRKPLATRGSSGPRLAPRGSC